MGNLILRYERAMAERLDGDKAAALRLVDDLIQVLHLFPKTKGAFSQSENLTSFIRCLHSRTRYKGRQDRRFVRH